MQTDLFFLPLGNGASSAGLTIRHPALTSVRVPSGPPLAFCYPDRGGYGVPGDKEVHPQGPGCEKCAAGFQGDGEDRGLWSDERPEPRDGSLHHDGTQTHPVRVVRTRGRGEMFKVGRRNNLKQIFNNHTLLLVSLPAFLPGVLQSVFVSAPSPMPQTFGCLVSPCGRCSLTVRSPGSVCRADRYTHVSPFERSHYAFSVCIHASQIICLRVWNACPRPNAYLFFSAL